MTIKQEGYLNILLVEANFNVFLIGRARYSERLDFYACSRSDLRELADFWFFRQ